MDRKQQEKQARRRWVRRVRDIKFTAFFGFLIVMVPPPSAGRSVSGSVPGLPVSSGVVVSGSGVSFASGMVTSPVGISSAAWPPVSPTSWTERKP